MKLEERIIKHYFFFLLKLVLKPLTMVSLCRGMREISLWLIWESYADFLNGLVFSAVRKVHWSSNCPFHGKKTWFSVSFSKPYVLVVCKKMQILGFFFFSSFTKPPGSQNLSLSWGSWSPQEPSGTLFQVHSLTECLVLQCSEDKNVNKSRALSQVAW